VEEAEEKEEEGEGNEGEEEEEETKVEGGGGPRPSECLFSIPPQQPPCHGLHVLGVAARGGGGGEREAADQQQGGARHGHGPSGVGVFGNERGVECVHE